MAHSKENVVAVYVAAFICAVLGCASIFLFYQETRIFGRPKNTAPEFADFVSRNENRFALSAYSKTVALSDCWFGLNPPARAPEIADRKLQTGQVCREIGRQVLAQMPTNGLAWVVTSQASLVRGDLDGFRFDLLQSRRVTPNEGAMARLRILLAEGNLGTLDAETKAAHLADITMLAMSDGGMRWLADWYRANPLYRDRIVEVIDGLSGERQQKFLYMLKNPT